MAILLKAGNSGRFRSGVVHFAVTLVAVVAAVIVAKVMQSYWKSEAFGSLFFCAIMFSGWFGGYRQGLLAVILSTLAFNFFFLARIHSMAISFSEVPRLIIFVLCALLVGFLAASQRHHTASLRRARDELAEKLEALKKTNAFLDAENARRKLAEEALQHSQAYLAEAQRLSHTGSFGWRVATGELFWTEETHRIFQLDPKTKPTLEFVLQRVHPDDATLVQETIGNASHGGRDFDFEHRLRMPDGSIKYVHVVAHADTDSAGEVEFVGAVMDVTVANEEDNKIRLIINTVPGLLWTARPDGWVDFLNQRWLDYTGMTLEQGLGWAWQPGYHPDDLGKVLSEWQAAVAEKKPLEVEARVRRFDGEYRWFLKRAFPLFDNTGRVLGWYGGNIDVHDLKQTEEKLRRTENYLTEGQRLSRTGSWAWSVKTRENLFWSRESYRIFGFDPDIESGRYGPARDRIHPADRRAFDEALEQAIQEQKDFVIDYRILLPGGEVKHIHNLGHPVFNSTGELVEYIGTTMDVTERKHAEEALQARERELRLIAESIPGMIVVNSPDGSNEYTTQRLLDFVGRELGDLKGLKWVSVLHPDDADSMVNKWLDSVKTGRPMEVIHRMRRADGVYRWFQSRVEPLFDAQGKILRWYGLIIDVDDQINAAEVLRKTQAELAHVSRLTTMGELTASIAHEVNQPLTAVVNNANASLSLLPKDTPDLEEVREALAEIIEDANRASDVISRIRRLAKRAPIEKSFLDLRDVVQDVLELARYESSVRQVTICTDLAKDLPSVSGDRVQLQQVLLNLVINGMDAMNQVEESKRVLTICGRHETHAGTPAARLSVSDSGVGFKPGEMDRLFAAFYTTKPQGMGMGLAISRSIIEAHGGRLWAEPNLGPGAIFLLSLPAAGNKAT